MRPVLFLLAAFFVTGCAATPRLLLTYPLTRTSAEVTLTRTLKCDKANIPVIVSSPNVKAVNGADRDRTGKLDTSPLDNQLADTSLDIQYWDDGRLKSINGESTGQGETILKSAISLAGGVLRARDVGTGQRNGPTEADIVAACRAFAAQMGDQSLAINYSKLIDFSTASVELAPEPDQAINANRYAVLLGKPCAVISTQGPPLEPVHPLAAGQAAWLSARQPGLVRLQVVAVPSGADCTTDASTAPIWDGIVLVGQDGLDYRIPIPASRPFGKQSFQVEFGDSGNLTHLKYGKETGAGQAVNVAQALANQMKPSDADETKRLNDEADRIKAQQRLADCRADHSKC